MPLAAGRAHQRLGLTFEKKPPQVKYPAQFTS